MEYASEGRAFSQSPASLPKGAAPPSPHLDTILERAKSQNSGLVFIHQHIVQMLNRALGEGPEGGRSASPLRAVQSGTIGAIMEAQAENSEKISEISELLARLETIA